MKHLNSIYGQAFYWGGGLWFVGYTFSLILFPFVPTAYIGIPVLTILSFLTYLATKKVFMDGKKTKSDLYFMALVWAIMALIMDYLFIVTTFNPKNFYDVDLILYYVLTFTIPIVFGMKYIDKKSDLKKEEKKGAKSGR